MKKTPHTPPQTLDAVERLMGELALCDAARRRALAERCAPGPVAYLRGTMAQAGWRDALYAADGEWWLDLDAVRLGKLFQMLDTHRRRLLRRVPCRLLEARWDGTLAPMRRGFEIGARYVVTERGLLKQARPAGRGRRGPFRVRFVAGGGVGAD